MRAKAPCPQKIVFRAGAVDGRPRLAIDEKHVVAFAPPEILILQDGHRDPCKLSAPASFHPDIVVFATEVGAVIHFRVAILLPVVDPTLCGRGLAILSMKIQSCCRKWPGAGAVI